MSNTTATTLVKSSQFDKADKPSYAVSMRRIRVAIYCRLSDEDKDKKNVTDESESIQNQKSMLLAFTLEHGWDVYKIYCDDDYSGVDKNRPEWNEMIRDAEDGKFDVVLCKTQSRFSRDMEMVERYIHGKFMEWGVRFVSIVDHADTSVAGNKKARQINGLVNEWLLEDMSDNIRKVLEHKKRNGEFCGSFAPYGYAKDPKDKHKLIIDPEAAEVVKEIFHMFLSGMGYWKIAQELNRRGVPSPAKHKNEKGLNYVNSGKHVTKYVWKNDTIQRILKNEMYIGTLVQGKAHNLSYKNKKRVPNDSKDWIRVENAHEAIIDIKDWGRVQENLGTRTRPEKMGVKHMFAGKVFCQVCGNPMLKAKYKVNSELYYYLRCRTPWLAPDLCNNRKSLVYDKLKVAVLDEINGLLDKYFNPDLIEFETVAKEERDTRLRKLEAERDVMIRERDIRVEAIKQLYLDKVSGVITTEQFAKFNGEFEKEVERYNEAINEISEKIAGLSNTKDETREEILNKYRQIDELTRVVVDEFIERINIGEYDKEANSRRIEIIWKI